MLMIRRSVRTLAPELKQGVARPVYLGQIKLCRKNHAGERPAHVISVQRGGRTARGMAACRVHLPGFLLHKINRLDFCRGCPVYFYPDVAFTGLWFRLKPDYNRCFFMLRRIGSGTPRSPGLQPQKQRRCNSCIQSTHRTASFSGHVKALMAGYDGIDCNAACVVINCRDCPGPVCRHPLLPAGHQDKIVNCLRRGSWP